MSQARFNRSSDNSSADGTGKVRPHVVNMPSCGEETVDDIVICMAPVINAKLINRSSLSDDEFDDIVINTLQHVESHDIRVVHSELLPSVPHVNSGACLHENEAAVDACLLIEQSDDKLATYSDIDKLAPTFSQPSSLLADICAESVSFTSSSEDQRPVEHCVHLDRFGNVNDCCLPDDEDEVDGVQSPVSALTESLLSCGRDQLYQQCHSLTELLDDDDYVFPDDELHDDLPSHNEASAVQPGRRRVAKHVSQLVMSVQRSKGMRTPWSNMPEVVSAGTAAALSEKELRMQECIFDIISSEVVYHNSISLLCSHFMGSLLVNTRSTDLVQQKIDHRHLFSNFANLRAVSERFLQQLEAEWNKGPLLNPGSVARIVQSFADEHFKVFERYCRNEIYQKRTLDRLKKTNAEFRSKLAVLESDPRCQRLNLQSFFALPMQRVTRLPLLLDAIYKNLKYDDPSYEAVKHCLTTLHELAKNCNECKRTMENAEEVAHLRTLLDFSKVKLVSLAQQQLVRNDRVTLVRNNASPLQKILALHKEPIRLILFTDHLIVAKQRCDKYEVIDHVARKMTDVKRCDDVNCPPEINKQQSKLAFILALLNADKCTEYLFLCDTESDCDRWVQAFTPITVQDDVVSFKSWDCPQVQATRQYVASQPDELSLEEGDVISVSKKHIDGMYEGQRLRDGAKGWFPADHTHEIVGEHAKARNIKMFFRYKKLMMNDEDGQIASPW